MKRLGFLSAAKRFAILGFSLLPLLWTLQGFGQTDNRMVSGVKVDLTPLHVWYQKQEGDRPLKHWKRLRVETPKDDVATWRRIVCKNDDDETQDILVSNLPDTVLRFLEQTKSLVQQLNGIDADLKQLQDYVFNKEAGLSNYTSTVSTPEYMGYMADLDSHRTALRHKQDDRDALQGQLDKLAAQQAEELTIFAMFTGRTYSKLQVWDCGKPVASGNP
jgi:hypothetical protein